MSGLTRAHHRNCGAVFRFGIKGFETAPAEDSQALEIDDANSDIRSVLFSKAQEVFRGTSGNCRRGDYGKGNRVMSGHPLSLKHRLCEQGYQSVAAPLSRGLYFDGVGVVAPFRYQIWLETAGPSLSLDMPAGIIEQLMYKGLRAFQALLCIGSVGDEAHPLTAHTAMVVYRGHEN